MAITHQLTYTYVASGNRTDVTSVVTSESESNLDIVVPNSSSAYAVEYTLDYSQCKSLFILADAALTLKTNSSGAPAQTFSLTANTPITWISASNSVCPITTDITQLFVSSSVNNLGGNLTIRTLTDATI